MPVEKDSSFRYVTADSQGWARAEKLGCLTSIFWCKEVEVLLLFPTSLHMIVDSVRSH